MYYSFIGSSKTVKRELSIFAEETAVDEIMVVSHIYEHQARLRSYEILGQLEIPKVKN
jgi:alkanesulfonate monooxygenase SsuD/methylene tetrahydromethanopterin reductase-like flavin-dependent oxidoreductase (luciferase family)